MREFLVIFFIYILEKNECYHDVTSVEQRLATELFKTDKYMKTVSPLYPTFEVLDSSITNEKAAEICSNWLEMMFRSWSSEFKLEEIANSAFNCVWREDHRDGSPINATADCISWLRHIYWKNADYPYEGNCNPTIDYQSRKTFVDIKDDTFYLSSFVSNVSSTVSSTDNVETSTTVTTTSSSTQNPHQRALYWYHLQMLEDLLTEMITPPIMVEVSMELVSLNSIDLADSSMDTTIVLFFSWNDPRLSWNREEYGNTQRIVVDPDLIWTPPIEIVNCARYPVDRNSIFCLS